MGPGHVLVEIRIADVHETGHLGDDAPYLFLRMRRSALSNNIPPGTMIASNHDIGSQPDRGEAAHGGGDLLFDAEVSRMVKDQSVRQFLLHPLQVGEGVLELASEHLSLVFDPLIFMDDMAAHHPCFDQLSV